MGLTKEEQRAIKEFKLNKGIPGNVSLTFGDVALPEKYSEIRSRKEISDFTSELIPGRLKLNIPFISANMESVTGVDMTIAIEREGGLGILPQSLPLERRLKILNRVKRADCALIRDPATVDPDTSLKEAQEKMSEFQIKGLIVVDKDRKPVGILSKRDWVYEDDMESRVKDVMTKDIVTAKEGISFKEARKILKNKKIEKLPLVDNDGVLRGLITAHGMFYKKRYPRAIRDSSGQFLRIGSIGVGKQFTNKYLKEVEAQVSLGITALLIDTARAHSINTKDAIEKTKKEFPDLPLIVGNVSTPEGTKFLCELGVDVIKVGIGPGHACTTRMVGVGIPQLTSVAECGVIAHKYGKTVIADGGIKSPGDVTKAIIAGADALMIGYLFAGTEESASPSYPLQIKELGTDITAKDYFGSASFEAQSRRVKGDTLNKIRRPEGIKKRVPVIGPLKRRVDDLLNGLRSSMSYLGVTDIKSLKQKGDFRVQTKAGLSEGIDKYDN